jgi:hypothetical protein
MRESGEQSIDNDNGRNTDGHTSEIRECQWLDYLDRHMRNYLWVGYHSYLPSLYLLPDSISLFFEFSTFILFVPTCKSPVRVGWLISKSNVLVHLCSYHRTPNTRYLKEPDTQVYLSFRVWEVNTPGQCIPLSCEDCIFQPCVSLCVRHLKTSIRAWILFIFHCLPPIRGLAS